MIRKIVVSAKVNKDKAEKGERGVRSWEWGGNFRQASQGRPKQKGNISVRHMGAGGGGVGGGDW